MLAGLSPARRRLVLVLVAAAVLALVAGVVAVVVPALRGKPTADQATPGPVLLVPGYGGSTAALQTLADRLDAEGRDAAVVPLPGDGTGDLRASADTLGSAVTAAMGRTGARSVDLVGYSAGGVVARLWAADGGASLARRIVTLGAPHHGTRVADVVGDVVPGDCPVGCQELATDSQLLLQLNARDETPAGPIWVSIWTTQDTTVTPPDSARLSGAVNIPVQSVCPNARVSHGDLPRDPLVQAMVIAELGPGSPPRLGTQDCARLSSGETPAQR